MSGLVVTLGVLAIAAFTAGTFALRTVSRIWLRHWVERRPAGAALAEEYLARPQRLHAAAGGATAAAAFVVGAAAVGARPPVAAAVWLVLAFTAACVVGIAVPRGLARRWPTRAVPVGLPLLRAADVVLAPIRVLAARTVGEHAAMRHAGAEVEPAPRSEFEDLLREGQLEGVGEATELAIISGVVQFGDKRASDVMTPRAHVFALDADAPLAELTRAVAQSGYSRIPLYRGSLDAIIGVVLAFDMLQTAGEVAPPVHPVLDSAADLACTDLLARMLRTRLHLAVVRDAAGAALGIVTLEDLLEELVGDIRDEHDEPAPPESSASAGS